MSCQYHAPLQSRAWQTAECGPTAGCPSLYKGFYWDMATPIHQCIYCPWLLLSEGGRTERHLERPDGPYSLKYLLSALYRKGLLFCDPVTLVQGSPGVSGRSQFCLLFLPLIRVQSQHRYKLVENRKAANYFCSAGKQILETIKHLQGGDWLASIKRLTSDAIAAQPS